MRARLLVALAVVLAATAASAPGFAVFPSARSTAPPARAAGVLLVKFTNLSPAGIEALNRQFGTSSAGVIPGIDVHRLAVPPGRSVEEMVAAYRALADVEFAEPDFIAEALDTIPNDPLFTQQWGPTKVRLPAAWDITTGSTAVTVAVVDTGVDWTHPDLQGRFASGYNFASNTTNTQDDHGHGTHVAGIIGALTNTIGVAGTNWRVTMLPVKVLDKYGSGTYSAVASGITYAADRGATVINLSLGGSAGSDTLKAAVDYAWNKGVLLACAAGNSNGPVLYPAAYPNCTAVAATDQNDQKASFSSFGPQVELSAPGVGILSTVPVGSCALCDPSGYRSLSGTSMAAPHVAGLAALLFTYFGGATNAAVRNQMEAYADDLGVAGWDQYFGYGRINAYRAVTGVFPAPPIPPLPPPPPGLGVQITNPADGSTVTGVVPIQVSITGGYAPYYVEVRVALNKSKILCALTTSSTTATCSWSSNKGPAGTYSIWTFVQDAAYTYSTYLISVTVSR